MELSELLERVLSDADDGDWAAAGELLHEYREDFDSEPAVHCWLGVVERELGNEGVAYDFFKAALALQPVDPYVLATAGNGIAAFDDPEAMDALKAAALTGPDIPVTRLLYGAYLAREGFHDWALEQLQAARRLEPDDPQIAYELGVAKALAGDMEGATDAVADAVQSDPEDAWIRTVFGLLLLETDRGEEAIGELAEGARMAPEDVEAQLLAAAAAGALSHDGVAYEMLERARMRASEPDLVWITSVEEHLDSGPDAVQALLHDAMAPEALRSRLSQRP